MTHPLLARLARGARSRFIQHEGVERDAGTRFTTPEPQGEGEREGEHFSRCEKELERACSGENYDDKYNNDTKI